MNTKSLYQEITKTAVMESNQYISPYSPNTDADRRKMLGDIGVESSDILFNDIPDEYRKSQSEST